MHLKRCLPVRPIVGPSVCPTTPITSLHVHVIQLLFVCVSVISGCMLIVASMRSISFLILFIILNHCLVWERFCNVDCRLCWKPQNPSNYGLTNGSSINSQHSTDKWMLLNLCLWLREETEPFIFVPSRLLYISSSHFLYRNESTLHGTTYY